MCEERDSASAHALAAHEALKRELLESYHLDREPRSFVPRRSHQGLTWKSRSVGEQLAEEGAVPMGVCLDEWVPTTKLLEQPRSVDLTRSRKPVEEVKNDSAKGLTGPPARSASAHAMCASPHEDVGPSRQVQVQGERGSEEEEARA